MTGIVLVCLAALALIWALRRVGTLSIEERAMLAQLEAGTLNPAEVSGNTPKPSAETTVTTASAPADSPELALTRSRWDERFAKTELAKDETAVLSLLRDWLKAREFPLLAKAVKLFGDRLLLAFPSDGELAHIKAEFVDYLKDLGPDALPTDVDFFAALERDSMSSSLLSQSDADTYVSLREEFGSAGAARLVQALPGRSGALLFATLPPDSQEEVARMLPPDTRWAIATELLTSNRMSKDERAHLFEMVDAARAGLSLPPAPKKAADFADRGRTFDAAGALSVLLQHVPADERPALFTEALARSNGVYPLWYEDILYPDMVLKLPAEARADLVLELDIKPLAGWVSVQGREWQRAFVATLSNSMQAALRSNSSFASRAEQLSFAQRGRAGLVTATKRLLSAGAISFDQLVA